MSKLSLNLQRKALQDMSKRQRYFKKLAGFEYVVLPKVYKGSTDTELFTKVIKIKPEYDVWDVGTGTGLIALSFKKKGARHVLATDLNSDAVKNAKENSELLKLPIDVRKVNLFGTIKEKFDVITFNPPFTNASPKTSYDISFWDKDNKTVKRFFKDIHQYLKPTGKAFIAWSSFADKRKLKAIAKDFGIGLKEMGKKRGKMGFVYYVFELVFKD